MPYVAVKGGTEAIEASIQELAFERLRSRRVLDVGAAQAGLRALVDQVMSEGSLYSESVAALAIKQAEGSPEEAVFLLRAFRSTLPRKHYSLEVRSESMRIERRISAAFKDIPGGQILGATCDYTHRLVDPALLEETDGSIARWIDRYEEEARAAPSNGIGALPKVADYLRRQGLLRPCPPREEEPRDVTRQAVEFPTVRSERLQILTRGQTGAVTALGYAALRGYGALHPTVGELRVGMLPVHVPNPYGDPGDREDAYYVGEIRVTEVETVIPVSTPLGQGKSALSFELGYGICYGRNDTKAIAMSILDQCLETGDKRYPTHDEEFVLLHVDPVEATGFISHLKLPHYVTFQSKLDALRGTRPGNGA